MPEVVRRASSGFSGDGQRFGIAVTVTSMTRLSLPKKQLLVAEKPFLPVGDCLPSWSHMPLQQKLPAYRMPQGAMELATRRLSQPAYINRSRVEFDLSDPNNFCIDNEYNSLMDPHLRNFYRSRQARKRLVENGEMTRDDLVLCSLKDFNKYRGWLKHVGLLHYHKQQEDERRKEWKLKNLQTAELLDLKGIESQLHDEQVRQRYLQQSQAGLIRRRSQLFDLEERIEKTKKQREERKASNGGLLRLRREHRKQVYDKAKSLEKQETLRKQRNCKHRMKRHDEYLRQLEDSRVDEVSQKIQDEWERRKSYQQKLQEELKQCYQLEDDISLRYQRLFTAEMNKRWQVQTDALRARLEKAKVRRQNYEEENACYIACTFARNPRINPLHTHTGKDLRHMQKSESQDGSKTRQDSRKFDQESVDDDLEPGSAVAIPSFTSIFFVRQATADRARDLAVLPPIDEMGVNIRLHPLKDKKSAEELERIQKAIAAAYKQVSGLSIAYLPGMKRPKKKGKARFGTESSMGADHDEADGSGVDQDQQLSLWISMTNQQREELELLLQRLLSDLNSGGMDQEDLLRLAACCAFLTGTQLTEHATSTTSLTTTAVSSRAEERGSVISSDTSLHSASLDRFVEEALDKVLKGEKDMEEDYCKQLVDDTVRRTVSSLAQDLHTGTLTRKDIREIGSAVASVVVGEVRSEGSCEAEELVVPTLQRLLQEVDSIDEGLLDSTLASLLITYHHVSRSLDRPLWQVIKDFAVEILLRTKVALVHGDTDCQQFLEKMEASKTTPLHQEMELPRPKELVQVLSRGIVKLDGVSELCPVLCDVMKLLLDVGRPLLIAREGWDTCPLPLITSTSLQRLAQTACGLEVALEVTATVADALYRDMLGDALFEETLRLALAPALCLILLTSWGEVTAAVPTDSIAVKTSAKELHYVPRLGENVVLIACERLFREATQDRLPQVFITHLALHVAEFPRLVQLSAVLHPDDSSRVQIPPYVLRKIQALSAMVQDGDVGQEEIHKLLALVLHVYLKEVLMAQDKASKKHRSSHELHQAENSSTEDGDAYRGDRGENTEQATVTYLIRTLATILLHDVQNQVVMKLDSHAPDESMDVAVPWDSMQLMAEQGLLQVQRQVRKGLTSAHLHDPQLTLLASIATLRENPAQQTTPVDVEGFLKQVVRAVEEDPPCPVDRIMDDDHFHAVHFLFRKQLGSMADQVIKQMAGIEVLHQAAMEMLPQEEKMVTFLSRLLLQLHTALCRGLLSTDAITDFLQTVACEFSPLTFRGDNEQLSHVILSMVNDIAWRRNRSIFFCRLISQLSRLSLDPSHQCSEVAESMATTAELVSSVSSAVLEQFLQTTLLSLLQFLRESNRHLHYHSAASQAMSTTSVNAESIQTETPDPTSDRRLTPQSSVDCPNSTLMPTLSTSDTTLTNHTVPRHAEQTSHSDRSQQTSENHEEKEELGTATQNISDTMDQQNYISADNEHVSKLVVNMSPIEQPLSLDKESQMEIMRETDFLTHVAIHSTLERLEMLMKGSRMQPEAPPALSLSMQASSVVSTLVRDFDDVAAKTKTEPDTQFTDLNPTMVPYAQDLMGHVSIYVETEKVENEAEGRGPSRLKTENMGAIIISNAMKSVECEMAAIRPNDDSMSRLVPSVTEYISSTLQAIHSELDELHSTASLRVDHDDSQSVSFCSSSADPSNVQRASHIVLFLLQRLNKFSPVISQEGQAALGSVRDRAEERGVEEPHSASLSDTILQVFREVLHDMQEQNQFFSHRKQQEPGSRGMVVMASLPCLMDEYILSHLQDMAVKLTHQGPQTPTDRCMLSAETYAVATKFHVGLMDTLAALKATARDAGSVTQAENMKVFLLAVLEKSVAVLLQNSICVTPDNLIPDKKLDGEDFTKSSSKTKCYVDVSAKRTNMDVKNDLNKLLVCLGNMRTVSDQGMESSEDVHEEKQMVCDAIQQIIVSLQEDRVSEDVLNDLCDMFLERICTDENRDSRLASLVAEFQSLMSTVQSGHISRTKLAQTAAHIRVLAKRHLDDPRLVAGALRRVSSATQSSNAECLKVALQDLLLGLNVSRQSSGQANDQESCDDETGRAHAVVLGDGKASEEIEMDFSKTCLRRPVSMDQPPDWGKRLSRTISKTEIDSGLNRQELDSFVYPSTVEIKRNSISNRESFCLDSHSRHFSSPTVTFDQLAVTLEEPDHNPDSGTEGSVEHAIQSKHEEGAMQLSGNLSTEIIEAGTPVQGCADMTAPLATKEGQGCAQEEELDQLQQATYKANGSKGSLEAAAEDWNRSAIRVRSENFVNCKDDVDQLQPHEPQDALLHPTPQDCERTSKWKEPIKSSTKVVNAKACGQNLLNKSEACAIAIYSQPLLVKQGSSQEKKKCRVKSSQNKNKCCQAHRPDPEPTGAFHKYGDCRRFQISQDMKVAKSSQDIEPGSQISQDIGPGSQISQNIAPSSRFSQDMKVAESSQDIEPGSHDNVPHIHVLEKDDLSLQGQRQQHITDKAKSENQPKRLKADKSLKQGVAAKGKKPSSQDHRQLENRFEYAKTIAFSLGFSLFNSDDRQIWLNRQNRADRRRVGQSLPITLDNHAATATFDSCGTDPSLSKTKSCPSQRVRKKTMKKSEKKKAADKSQDSTHTFAHLSDQKQPGETEGANSTLGSLTPPKQNRSRGTGFLRKLMEWNTEPVSSSSSDSNDWKVWPAIGRPQSAGVSTSDTSDPEQPLANTQNQTENRHKVYSPSTSAESEEEFASMPELSPPRFSRRRELPDVQPAQPLAGTLTIPRSKGLTSFAGHPRPPAHQKGLETPSLKKGHQLYRSGKQQTSTNQTSQPTDNSESDNRKSRYSRPSCDGQTQLKEESSIKAQVQGSESSFRTASRRRVKLFPNSGMQMHNIPMQHRPRPPDAKRQ